MSLCQAIFLRFYIKKAIFNEIDKELTSKMWRDVSRNMFLVDSR
jgi:hypothetical protein